MFRKIFNYILQNKITLGIMAIYALIMISVIDWGIPNLNHPYTYHMDEWHQLQSIRALYEYGSPNISGAANGTIFQFLLSGIYLSQFVLFKIIDPFVIKSSAEALFMQERIFEILRLNTLIFGILSMLVLAHLGKKYFWISPVLTLIFFTVTPLWLSLSNYFKYDIALTFWIIASLSCLLRYGLKPNLKNYIIAGIFCALALATKISAIPLFLIYIFSFFYFNFGKRKRYNHLLIGILLFIVIFAIFGIPDLILQKGDYREYLHSNLIRDQINFKNFKFEFNLWWMQILLKVVPLDFGYVFSGIFIFSLFYWSVKLIPKIIKLDFNNFKNEVFVFISMILFVFSLIPLQFGANGNRILVLLPFFAIFSGLFTLKMLKRFSLFKIQIYIILIVLFTIQFIQSFAMIYVKWKPDPRQLSSYWMRKNVGGGTTLGIENTPIYQELPDIVVKEFYLKDKNNLFKYEIINDESAFFPDVIIITNKEFDMNYLKKSSKKDLLAKLSEKNYKIIKEFKPSKILYRIMGNELAFYSSGIVTIPTITIYKRDKNPQN